MYTYIPYEDDVFASLKTLDIDHKQYHDNLEDMGCFGWPRHPEIGKAISEALTGKKKSDTHRKNLSKSRMGKNLGPQSEEHKRKRLDSIRGENNGMRKVKPDQQYKDKMSEATKGIKWWTNGITNVKSRICPDGFAPGRLMKKKL